MSSNIDPTTTIFNAFGDIGNRLIRFSVAIIGGLFIGIFSCWVAQLFVKKDSSAVAPTHDAEIYMLEESSQNINLDLVLIAGVGVPLLLFGLTALIKGSDKLPPPIASMLGCGLLSILGTTKWGWSINLGVWILFTALSGVGIWLFKQHADKQEELRQSELDKIYEENRLRREKLEQERLAEEEENAQEGDEPEAAEDYSSLEEDTIRAEAPLKIKPLEKDNPVEEKTQE